MFKGDRKPGPCIGSAERLAAARLLEESSRVLARLRVIRGASWRTHRRMARATAVIVAAAGLLGAGPLRSTAVAAMPNFLSPLPFGLSNVGYNSAPTFADSDGDLDAFIGAGSGNTTFFKNTGSSAAAAFAPSSANPFGLVDVGSIAAPALADIDGDGDLDAFIGEFLGNTFFFENIGSSSAAAFATSSANPFGLVDVGSIAAPAFADIDGDGDLDAFIGATSGNTFFFENTGSSSAAAFAPSSTNPFGLDDVGRGSAPTFADIDGDGDLDTLIGTTIGDTFFFENSGGANGGLDVDLRNGVDVATDIVYIARHLLSLAPVPPSFRTLDPTIPPDNEIAARINALL